MKKCPKSKHYYVRLDFHQHIQQDIGRDTHFDVLGKNLEVGKD